VKDASTHDRSRHGEDDAIIWQPSARDIERSRLRRFCESTGNDSLDALRSWAAQDIGRYWDAVVKDLQLTWSHPYASPLIIDRGKPWPSWFEGGGFNYVENAVDRHASGPNASRKAIIWEDEDGNQRSFSYADLQAEVNRFANALTSLGVMKGDRVGIFLPMVPETVIATLACGKVGAIYISLFSGYGEDAISTRLRDCEASILITADAFPRRGKLIPMKEIADAAMLTAPTVKTCITLQRTGTDVNWMSGRDYWWHDLTSGQPSMFETLPTNADDPYMIIYTSGTTGRPKGTVHVHAGFPIKAAHDLAYCFDLQEDDRIFWLSDLGWMMGPWTIAGGLMLNATLVLYEGTPDYPGPDRLWKLVADHKVTVLGVAPTAIRALKTHGNAGPEQHTLSSLRALGSTGESWDPASWRWFYEVIGKGKRPIINYSGGTETGGGILGCFTSEPITSCAFSGPIPGMDADVVDETCTPVRGRVGELIVRQPWVGMTQGFWQDPERYLENYWSRFPDVWVHGDWTEVDDDGYWHIRGRSDDVLKVAGKRIGPAELESAACDHTAVQESAAIGVPHELKGETIIVFAVLRPHHEPTEALASGIRLAMRQKLGASLQPERVLFIRELPKTRNGKIMRRVLRAAYLGLPTGEITALENPTIVDDIAALGQVRANRR
jgi:acetyl-CoA synthetase